MLFACTPGRALAGVAALLVFVASVLGAGSVSAQDKPADPPPMIRDLSPAKAQALGEALYASDQRAWHTTDFLIARKTDMRGVVGWIDSKLGDEHRVRYLKNDPAGRFAAFDVVIDARGAMRMGDTADSPLSEEDRLQLKALDLAMTQQALYCSKKPPNHVEIRDPDTGEWIVWILTPWEDTKSLPFGGHTRFTISPDATKIIRKEELARSCLKMPVNDLGMLMVGQLVSNVPVETVVFNALQAKILIGVAAPDKTWIVDGRQVVELESPEGRRIVEAKFPSKGGGGSRR
jgi:hypothetical protein